MTRKQLSHGLRAIPETAVIHKLTYKPRTNSVSIDYSTNERTNAQLIIAVAEKSTYNSRSKNFDSLRSAQSGKDYRTKPASEQPDN